MKNLLLFLFALQCTVLALGRQIEVTKGVNLAIAKALPGDTLVLTAKLYKEGTIEVNKPIHLIGLNKPVIDAEGKKDNLIVSSSGVKIQGIKFIGTGVSSMEDYAAIQVKNSRNIWIFNNEFEGAYFGIHVSNSTDVLVQNNTLVGPKNREQHEIGNGIHFWKCSRISILNNSISGHRDGIYFEFVRNSLIRGNKSKENHRYGLHFMFSDSDYYYRNYFEANGAGVAVMYSSHVHMFENQFAKNWGSSAYGLLLKDIRDSKILKNHFDNNSIGIHAEGCSRSFFGRNTFANNGYGLRLQADCDENEFAFNTFIQNSFDLITNGFTTLNTLKFNYWDQYKGFDLHRDGCGDEPYRPMSLFGLLLERNPLNAILLRSILAGVLDQLERLIPGLTPENLKDPYPLIHKPTYVTR
ncbi:MAG: nitrous oxide reductase family maturation protein NosD [Bacteroidia bacterium]|nr:nitrous oxide reductase family maturation protein NosD [Bacteroidia bacterium]